MLGLRKAIRRDQLRLEYQPKADMRSGRISGAEALVRWEHPRHGRLQPQAFVPRAERTPGLLKPLTEWVLNTALRQTRAWHLDGLDLRVAVNLSPRSIHDSHLVETIGELLSKWEVPPSHLELEITETAVFGGSDPERINSTLCELGEMGVKVALDDFGTGFSSLSHLKLLPISVIKVDKSFVTKMDEDLNDAQIVRSVVALAKTLGLTVVAEGVEREPLWHRLAELGCDVAQGNYLSAPLPAAEVPSWVRQWEELYGEAHRMAAELIERRAGPNDRRSGLDDRRMDVRTGPRFVRPGVESDASPSAGKRGT